MSACTRWLLHLLLALLLAPAVHAAGPRWVAGKPMWVNDGKPMAWYRNDLTYWVDQGPLSIYVDNASAQTLVQNAAAVWNIPYSNLSLTQGGSLEEDVSSGNVFVGDSGPIWPTDVASTNYTAKPIAVLFDTDGTLTEILLGSGASDPENCRQNAVTESVDLFVQPGSIAHAVILLNGRCTGPATEQQLQMQYQLMRISGRVLGLAWSQVNDNVFTGSPAPTYDQQMHWPIMHPIDILCGPYTYQCLPQPFTLRDDDRTAVRLLYSIPISSNTDGKELFGTLSFPNGRGMNGVNMVAVRQPPFGQYPSEPWETTSVVSGYLFRGNNGNPVTGALTGFASSQGSMSPALAGYWNMQNVPVIANATWDNVFVKMQAANPLYIGQYSIGPQSSGPILPSGSPTTTTFTVVARSGGTRLNTTVANAASACDPGGDGTAALPAPVVTGGTWTGLLCGYGHTSWGSFAVQAGRSATLEVTGTDESGSASSEKSHPLIGLWHSSDPEASSPTIDFTPSPFNARLPGMTQLQAAFDATETIRFAITDERGEGRPDFSYRARLLYADSASPTELPSSGGMLHIFGYGFQTGNVVTVGGVAAKVTSITASEIDAVAPTLAAVGSSVTNDVTVTDLRTGGTSTITGGVTYSNGSPNQITVVAAPVSGTVIGGYTSLTLRLTDSSGTPVVNGTLTLTIAAGSATISGCDQTICTLATGSDGQVSAGISPAAAGIVVLEASATGATAVYTQFTAIVPSQGMISALVPAQWVFASSAVPIHPAIQLALAGTKLGGIPVQWSTNSADVSISSALTAAAADGTSTTEVLASLAPGELAQVRACAWTGVCTSIQITGVGAGNLNVASSSGDAQYLPVDETFAPVDLAVTEAGGHPVAGAPVFVYQSMYAWQPACPPTGRCATAPLLARTQAAATSGDDGHLELEPLSENGIATVTHVLVTAGSGTTSFTLIRHP